MNRLACLQIADRVFTGCIQPSHETYRASIPARRTFGLNTTEGPGGGRETNEKAPGHSPGAFSCIVSGLPTGQYSPGISFAA
ncbi:hypothetical protein RCH21_002158 [Arthrobacter sp. PL16]|uniref:hypothetical protein n=1 Tax=Arthrobacter sp. PL16 TaxID=3071720 RepID=UPI002E059BBC|nr:hypothetical protein [Arthrobacter sp. PL16]